MASDAWIDALAIDDSAWVAPGAIVVGRVTLEARVSIWYGCVLRGDLEPIRIGAETNIQDLTMVHVDRDLPCTIGRRVTVGHRCIIHACEVGDGATIGMGATLLSGCKIGRGALVAAGAVVREGMDVPDGAFVAGVPAKIKGSVDDEMRQRFDWGVENYLQVSRAFREGQLGHGPHSGRSSHTVEESSSERRR